MLFHLILLYFLIGYLRCVSLSLKPHEQKVRTHNLLWSLLESQAHNFYLPKSSFRCLVYLRCYCRSDSTFLEETIEPHGILFCLRYFLWNFNFFHLILDFCYLYFLELMHKVLLFLQDPCSFLRLRCYLVYLYYSISWNL